MGSAGASVTPRSIFSAGSRQIARSFGERTAWCSFVSASVPEPPYNRPPFRSSPMRPRRDNRSNTSST